MEPVGVETAVREALLGSTAIAAIAEDRVYPVRIPNGAALPCLTFHRLAGTPHMSQPGYGSESVTISVVAYSKNYEEAKALAKGVRKAMAAGPLCAVLKRDWDGHHEEADAFSVSMKFICNQHGGYWYGD